MNDWRTKVRRVYRRSTADNRYLAYIMPSVMACVFIVVTTFTFGILMGANAGLEGKALADAVSQLERVEFNMWTDAMRNGALYRSVYGVFHFIAAISVEAAVLGARLGYAAPTIGHVISPLAKVIPIIFLALIALQVVRLFEGARGHV